MVNLYVVLRSLGLVVLTTSVKITTFPISPPKFTVNLKTLKIVIKQQHYAQLRSENMSLFPLFFEFLHKLRTIFMHSNNQNNFREEKTKIKNI